MAAPLAQHARKPESPAQVIKEDEVIFGKKYQVIYDVFSDALKSETLKPSEKEICTFISNNRERIFNNVNTEEIKSLSEKNFHKFLLSVYKRIRTNDLAEKKNLGNGKIQQVVDECVKDARGREAKDWIIGGIKSFLPGGELLKKIPYLGKFLGGEEEKKEKPLSDEQMVTKFLRKSLLPVVLFTLTLLIFGGGPIMTPIAVIGLLFTEYKVVKSLFSNNKEGTLYNPNSSDHPVACFSSHSKSIMEEATKYRDQCEQAKYAEEAKKWDKKTISDIRQTPVKTTEKGEQQPIPAVSQTNVAGVKTSWTGTEEKRRNSVTSSSGYQK